MAIIGRIRKHYWLLVVIIGVALLLFVLSDFSRKRSKVPSNVGVIAGEKISLSEFNKRFDENAQIQKLNSGKENLTADEDFQVRQNTWAQLVNEILMQKQYDKLGIAVSVDELNDLVRGNNPHPYIVQSFTDPKTGKFDKKAVDNFLQNLDNIDPAMKQRYLLMEKAIKSDRLTTKYNSLIQKGYYVPSFFAKRNYEESNKTAVARVVGVSYGLVSDSLAKVEDTDYDKYYAGNSYKFVQDKPASSIEYVLFEPAPSEEDLKKITDDVTKLYEEFKTVSDVPSFVNQVSDSRYDSTWKKKGSFLPVVDSMLFSAPVGVVFAPYKDNEMYRIYKIMDRQTKPDSLRASHILVSYTGTQIQGVTRSREAAEKVSDSIFNIVKSNPAALEAIAAAMSDDQGSKVKMGDLGWFADGAMVREFNKAVAEGAIGSVVKVESQFGFHILRVTGKKDPSVKIRVASVDRRIEPSAKTIEETYNKASAFAASNNTYEKFAKAAKDQGLNVRQQDRLTQNDGSIPGLKQARSVVQWAFNGDTEKGEVKFFETEGSYTVAALKYMVKPGIVPLEVIRESIKPLVVREKKAEIIMKKMTDLMAKQKDFAPIVNEYKVKIDTVDVSFVSANLPMHGHEPVVAGRIFAAKPGVFSAPLKGESGVYVFVLDSFKEAPETKDFNNQKKQMAMMFQGRANSVPSMLESKATIKDNRLMFF